MLNKRRLEAEMKLRGYNGQKMADLLGITRATFSMKLNENSTGFGFTKAEMTTIKKEWNLSAKDIDDIFFKI